MNNIYDDFQGYMQTLGTRYPDCIRVVPFGESYIGREIPALRLGDGYGHRLLYVGGITGALSSTVLLLRFARDYAEAVAGGRRVAGIDISYLLHTRTVTVVPLLNPDGAVLRLHGTDDKNPLLDRLIACRDSTTAHRTVTAENPFSDLVTNGRGVDLRCNCDASFDECVRTSDGIGYAGFPGMHPESEPECAAVCRYLRAQPTTDLTLLFDDEDSGGIFGRLTHAGGGNSCGGDRRTAGIASILARDIDAGNCITGTSEPAGSFARWYRTRDAGPLLTLSAPGVTEDGDAFCPEDATVARALLASAVGADDASSADCPGVGLSTAELALVYAKIRRALFHGAVL